MPNKVVSVVIKVVALTLKEDKVKMIEYKLLVRQSVKLIFFSRLLSRHAEILLLATHREVFIMSSHEM